MDMVGDDSKLYQSVQKGVSLTVAFLIGTKINFLVDNNPDKLDFFGELKSNSDAVVIRSLCNIRSNLMLNYTSTDNNIRFNMMNLDRMEIYNDDVRVLERHGIYIVKANCRVEKYIMDINLLISQGISSVNIQQSYQSV